jgi:hypothetical protein
MLADQAFDSACVDWSPVGLLTQREAALPSAAQRFAPLLFVSNTLASASGVNRQRPLWRDFSGCCAMARASCSTSRQS